MNLTKKNKRRILKWGLAVLFVCLLHYFGVFTHMHELEYERAFNYPLEGDVLRYAKQVRLQQPTEVPPINNLSYSYLHQPLKRCQPAAEPTLVFLIKSAMGHSQQRAAIRRTWGYEISTRHLRVQRIFVLGTSADVEQTLHIAAEARQHKDILQADFLDTYFNNTIKTQTALRWAVEHCAAHSGWHFMFVDDDYYVSIENVYRFIAQPDFYPSWHGHLKDSATVKPPTPPNEELYAGFVMQTAPHRHQLSKWYVPLSEYPFDKWPPYVTSGAYILAREALLKLYYVSLYTRPFRFDDIFMSIVALKAELPLVHCEYMHFTRPEYAGPQSYQHVIASHGFSDPKEMERIWEECRTAGFA